MATIKISTNKMKTIKLNKNGKCRSPRTKKISKYTLIEDIKNDIVKFAEKYWDNGGLYNDCDLDDIDVKLNMLIK